MLGLKACVTTAQLSYLFLKIRVSVGGGGGAGNQTLLEVKNMFEEEKSI